MTDSIEVLHTGDTHVGYRQYGSDRRREDFLRSFEAVVDDAVEQGYDVFVHAGDLFHSRNPGLVDVIPTVEQFERLSDAGVRAFAVVGNHESKRDAQWIDLLESLGLVERLGKDPVVVGDVAFYGVDYVPKSRIDSFDHDFRPSDARYNVLVAHGRFEPFPYGEWPLDEFVENGDVDWDAFLLGDYHHHEREEVEGVPAEYCGSTERASSDERESRGYNVVEFAEDDVKFTRRSLDHVTRDFVFAEVDVSGVDGDATGYVVDRVLDHDVEDAAVVVRVEGDGDADVVRSEIETAVESEGALVVRVNDVREVAEAEESEIEVSFADPDDAVRERVQEMQLTEPAVEVDQVVRGDTVADSNLADEIESRVDEAVSGGWKPDARPGDADSTSDDDGEVPATETPNDGETEEETETSTRQSEGEVENPEQGVPEDGDAVEPPEEGRTASGEGTAEGAGSDVVVGSAAEADEVEPDGEAAGVDVQDGVEESDTEDEAAEADAEDGADGSDVDPGDTTVEPSDGSPDDDGDTGQEADESEFGTTLEEWT